LFLAENLKAALAPAPVEPAFLELAEPTIDDAIGRLVEHDIRRLVTAPLLLFAAGHAKDDVPAAVSEALARRGLSALPRAQAAHLGCHPAILDLSQLRLEQSLAVPPPAGTVVLLVGRGSHDMTATAQMHEFARLKAERSGMLTEVAFLAMARPLLREGLATAAAKEPACVVVQPHLLFHGDLVEELQAQVDEAKRMYPQTEWEITSLLADPVEIESGGTSLLEIVLRERLQEALIRVVADSGDD
jgi:sirohydrochlorin cobaltochelatase